MRTFVVGTAGHIDHGKSSLVRALTGTDPDRLAEEKLRGMTIDLGFAHLVSPEGRSIGIVDVPGHERFIKTMLAGVGGIDAAILVVAADEGPMPQTVEHLDILTLLAVERGVVALTKADLVEPDWADYVAEELRERLSDTALAGSEIVGVSSVTGAGLPALVAALDRALTDAAPRPGVGQPRLPVDRAFTMTGFGTVVTGTLIDGELRVGMEVESVPSGRRARVRGLQTHGAVVDRAAPGQRVAVNLQGVSVDAIGRGDVVSAPGAVPATHMIDARLELLASAPMNLEHQARIDLFTGSAEVGARVSMIKGGALHPGEAGWAQLHLDAPIAVLRGDRIVLRRPSPSATIGGGTVIDAQPVRHRQSDTGVVERLEALARGTPVELLLAALRGDVVSMDEAARLLPSLPARTVVEALTEAIEIDQVLRVGSSHLVAAATWPAIAGRLTEALAEFHATNPLRRGMPREELRSKLRHSVGALAFDAVIGLATAEGKCVDDERTIRLPSFAVVLPEAERAAAARYLALVDEAPYSPPSSASVGLSPATLAALVERGELIDVGDGIVYRPETLDAIKALVLAHIDGHGRVTLADYRDAVGTSRKYAQATLEYLDGIRVTRRVGDDRVRGR